MLKKCLLLSAFAVCLAAASACSPLTTAPGDPADRVIQERVVASLGEYANTVFASTVNGRVYLNGWVPNFNDKQRILEAVEAVEGVNQIMDDILLEEVGSTGDGGTGWE